MENHHEVISYGWGAREIVVCIVINNVELTFPNLSGSIISVQGRMNRKSSGLNCRVFLFSKTWWGCFFYGFLGLFGLSLLRSLLGCSHKRRLSIKRSVWTSILFNQNARIGKRAVPDFTVHTYIFRGKTVRWLDVRWCATLYWFRRYSPLEANWTRWWNNRPQTRFKSIYALLHLLQMK